MLKDAIWRNLCQICLFFNILLFLCLFAGFTVSIKLIYNLAVKMLLNALTSI